MSPGAMFHVVLLLACLVSATLQTSLILLYKRSKPTLFVTLSDMMTCDLVYIFLPFMYVAVTVHSITSFELKVPFEVVLGIGVAFGGINITFLMYLLSACTVEYIHMRWQAVDLVEDFSQEEVLRFIRIVIAVVVAVMMGWKHYVAGYPPTVFFMSKMPFNNQGFLHAKITVILSLTVSALCLILKYLTLRKKKIILGGDAKLLKNKIPFLSYVSISFLLAFMTVGTIAAYLINDFTHNFAKQIFFIMLGMVFPFITINKDPKLRHFCTRKILNFLGCSTIKIYPRSSKLSS